MQRLVNAAGGSKVKEIRLQKLVCVKYVVVAATALT